MSVESHLTYDACDDLLAQFVTNSPTKTAPVAKGKPKDACLLHFNGHTGQKGGDAEAADKLFAEVVQQYALRHRVKRANWLLSLQTI